MIGLDLPKEYKYEMAERNGDFIDLHGEITNYTKLEEVYKTIETGGEASLRIVEYTIEGDPIISLIEYNGDVINYKVDTTRDKFGTPKVIEQKYTKLIKKIEEDYISYYLIDKDKSEVLLIKVSKNQL